jgi:RNA polymerase sigma factor (sigma-70 family)
MVARLLLPLAGTVDEDFSAFLRRYQARLQRVASAYAHTPADRADLLQDISVALWTARSTFRAECTENTFVYRVAHNVAIKHSLKARLPMASEGIEERLVSAEPGPDEAISAQDRTAQLQRAVRELPLGEREIAVLALEGLGNGEIAAVTGLSENHVGVRLFRAKAKLKAALSSAKPGERS